MDNFLQQRMIFILLLIATAQSVLSLTCVCDRQNITNTCGEPPICVNGTVLDACGCCQVCGKVDNETCGGPWEIYGKCADGFTCVFDAPDNHIIGAGGMFEYRKPVGICRETQAYLTETKKCLQELKHYYDYVSQQHHHHNFGHHKGSQKMNRCVFKPNCTPEGWFAPRQCSRCTDQCWCVDHLGEEIPNTRGHFDDVTC